MLADERAAVMKWLVISSKWGEGEVYSFLYSRQSTFFIFRLKINITNNKANGQTWYKVKNNTFNRMERVLSFKKYISLY
jgi:hypothetical protein